MVARELPLPRLTEIPKCIRKVGAQPDCDAAQKVLNERAENVVEEFREREKEFDRRTSHGARPADAR